jgi:vitellogenic carboxypeptidase-like protein
MKMYYESYHIAGIAVGNGFTDPITTLDYSDFVYQLGLVDSSTYKFLKMLEEYGKTAIQEGRFEDAFLVCTTIRDLNYSLPANLSSMSLTVFSFQCLAGSRSCGKF